MIGYGSHGSDLDDQLSVQSASSDSGIGLGNVASIGHFPHLSITDSVWSRYRKTTTNQQQQHYHNTKIPAHLQHLNTANSFRGENGR